MKFLKRLSKFWEKQIWFYIFLIIIFFISIKLATGTWFYETDLNIRRYFNNLKIQINQSEIAKTKKNIVIVWIDQKFFSNSNISIQGLHRWFYAKVIENLKNAGANTIAIDVFFEKKYKFPFNDKYSKILNKIFSYYDLQLAKSLGNNTILATVFDFKKEKIIQPDDIFLQNHPPLWHIHSLQFLKSAIHIGVYGYLQDKVENKIIYPFWLQSYITYIKNYITQKLWTGIILQEKISFDNNYLYLSIWNINKTIPFSYIKSSKRPFIFIPIYITNPQDYTYYSFYDIFTNNFSKKDIENKIVFIWAIDPTLNDIKTSLLGNIPGVLFHSNMFQSIMMNDFVYLLSSNQYLIFILTILILNSLIIIFLKNTKWLVPIFYYLIWIIISLTLVSIVLASLVKIKWFYIYLPLGTVIIITIFQIIAALIYANIENFATKEWFAQITKLYIGKQILKKKRDISKKIWEKKNISIYFSDLANFTNISEKYPADKITKLLNIYFEQQSHNIEKYNWHIDKYIWDAIMAFRDEEKYTDNAVKAAIDNIIITDNINQQIQFQLGIDEKLQTRIWIHFWPAIVWDIWSSTRLNYTAIGDNVNLASRLEWINKFYWTNICISEDTKNNLQNPSEFLIRFLDIIQVKWKSKPVKIFEVLPIKPINEKKRNKKSQIIKLFETGLNQYLKWNFAQAKKIFEQILQIDPEDKPSQIFYQRCNYLLKHPPENWDGIWKFKEK